MKKKEHLYWGLSFLSLLMFFIIWELVTDVFHMFTPQLLPSPIAVGKAFIYKLSHKSPDGSILIVHIISSLKIALTGYCIGSAIGVPLGILMGWYKTVDRLVKPLFDFLRNVPAIAWITLFVIFFRYRYPVKGNDQFLSDPLLLQLLTPAQVSGRREMYTYGLQKHSVHPDLKSCTRWRSPLLFQ